jgi:putative NADPH-quinone reductase
MRIQLIYAHPVEGSFCSKLRDIARGALQQSGHQVHVTDLYAEEFSPALSKQEKLTYEAAGQHHRRQDVYRAAAVGAGPDPGVPNLVVRHARNSERLL